MIGKNENIYKIGADFKLGEGNHGNAGNVEWGAILAGDKEGIH